jgi:hypothetical protein
MSVTITTKSLLPVRRDKQTAYFNSVTGGGGFSGSGSGGNPPAYISIIQGTPVAGQIATFHDASSIEGNTGFTYVNTELKNGIVEIDASGFIRGTTVISGAGSALVITGGETTDPGESGGDVSLAGGNGGSGGVKGRVTLTGSTVRITGESDYVELAAGIAVLLNSDLVCIGDGIGAGKLPAAGVGDDYVVTYNPTTGILSYLAI